MKFLNKLAGVVVAVALIAPRANAQQTMSLERAIGYSLANSAVIEAAEQQLNIAGQQVRQAWASALPDLNATASYQRNLKVQEGFLPAIIFDPTAPPDRLVPVRFGSDNGWAAGLTASQPLFEMGVFIGVGAAERFRSFQREALRGTAQNVVTGVRGAYLRSLLAVEQLRLSTESVARLNATLEDARSRNRAGLVSNYDVLRIEVQLANIEPQLRRSENAVHAARRTLAVELGMEADAGFELEGNLRDIAVDDLSRNSPENAALLAATGIPADVPIEFDRLFEIAMGRRSDVLQQRLNINLQEARVSAERANYFPKLSLFGNYNVTAQQNGAPQFFGGPNERTVSAATGVRVELPIFNGFERESKIQQMRYTVRQNEAQLDRLERVVANDIQTQLDNLEETRLRVRSQARAVEQATEGYSIATAEYRAGIGSQLQVTDAEEALRQSEFNHAQAVFDYLQARANLDAAVGLVPDMAGDAIASSGS